MSNRYNRMYLSQPQALELQRRCAAYEEVLLRIACYDDSGAWHNYHVTGKLSSLAEPGAALAADEVLKRFK